MQLTFGDVAPTEVRHCSISYGSTFRIPLGPRTVFIKTDKLDTAVDLRTGEVVFNEPETLCVLVRPEDLIRFVDL